MMALSTAYSATTSLQPRMHSEPQSNSITLAVNVTLCLNVPFFTHSHRDAIRWSISQSEPQKVTSKSCSEHPTRYPHVNTNVI